MATINYKIAGFSPSFKSDLGALVKVTDKGARKPNGIDPIAALRWAYNFDGVDDYGVLANRAINPDGNIDIEWEQRSVPKTATFKAIVTQSFNSVTTTREFGMFTTDAGFLDFRLGGNSFTSTLRDARDDGKYRVLLVGSTLTFFFNGVQFDQVAFTRGTAREPTAPTWICGRNGGGTLNNPNGGFIYNVKINGVLWAMNTRNSATQVSTPAGNTMTLVNTTSDRWQEIIE